MPRPNRSPQRRQKLLARVARTFAELGYRRTTTAELAERCGVPENTLFRLWSGKKGMFLASIERVFQESSRTWSELLSTSDSSRSAAQRLLEYEATHHGEHGLYRIVFAGLSETDDAEIRAALRRMYRRFHAFIREELTQHRGGRRRAGDLDPALAAWAILGLGTVANIGRELNLVSGSQRKGLFEQIGEQILGERAGKPNGGRRPAGSRPRVGAGGRGRSEKGV